MKKGTKDKIRKTMGIKKGGSMQISSHGAGEYSVQIIRGGKVCENISIPKSFITY